MHQGYKSPLLCSQLSTGEQQRLAIARVLINPTPIIILDEALSGIDVDTAQSVLASLYNNLPQTIIIMISHQPSHHMFSKKFIRLDTLAKPRIKHRSRKTTHPKLYIS
jgi:ABC-type uncharacterized transport system fused permease/ATPase subunit